MIRHPFHAVLAILTGLLLLGCQSTLSDPSGPALVTRQDKAPPGAPPGTCWGKDVTPAVIETVTEQVQTAPPEMDEAGRVIRPARYVTETRQEIVEERTVTWVEVPCADLQTADFIASVQRALIARRLYNGPVTGRMDDRTRAAIRRYQAPRGLDSGILSLETARELGLVAVERHEA
ncbi:hypothetical protein RA2_03348 [Roseovarius sp. A-2]|uniref:peptidoglycan-binding domain-containing protein n=1 Tax=Roseovarius sp. A-2 TaxID=1570360 RepID=UPI0009B5267D|nr:peptidoglycan-binding domain-containing protein [Roseovarius sp. A-2]GAW36278.1 hypothetical protein RA2_03348 [Roseovarius sp. A-2]